MSEQKINLKIIQTKNSIRKSLLEMLKIHNIDKISVSKLCKIAEINRTTFYNHYGSQYDVLNEIAETYFQNTSLTIINDLAAKKSIDECLTHFLQYIKDNIEFSKLILNQYNYNLINNIKITLPQFEHIIIRNLPESLDLDEKKAISSFVQYGTIRLIREWIFSDCLKSPKEEAKLILHIIRRTINRSTS